MTERHQKFVEDMDAAGIWVDDETYYGRYGYVGPAVRCERWEEDAVRQATTVRLTCDAMGLGIILYPA